MAVFLDESQAGAAQDLIGFPHLLVCLGVVLQTKRWLFGFHFARTYPDQNEKNAFGTYLTGAGAQVGQAVRLYGCCDWVKRYELQGTAGKAGWRAEMQQIARTIGYTGKASGFDTSIIGPQHGTYVEYRPEFAQEKCRIYYKRNEKMSYQKGAGVQLPPQPGGSFFAFQSGLNNTVVPKQQTRQQTLAATIVPTASNKGQLH